MGAKTAEGVEEGNPSTHLADQVMREGRNLLQADQHNVPDAPPLPGPRQVVVHLPAHLHIARQKKTSTILHAGLSTCLDRLLAHVLQRSVSCVALLSKSQRAPRLAEAVLESTPCSHRELARISIETVQRAAVSRPHDLCCTGCAQVSK